MVMAMDLKEVRLRLGPSPQEAESDLREMGCCEHRAELLGRAVSALSRVFRPNSPVVAYSVEGDDSVVDLLFYGLPVPSPRRVQKRCMDSRITSAQVRDVYLIRDFPARGFTVRLVAPLWAEPLAADGPPASQRLAEC